MSNIKGKTKTAEEFMYGSAGNVQPIKEEPVERRQPLRPEPRVQKNFRVRQSIANELMREAMEESIRLGIRVTQDSIIEEMLEERYKDK